MEEGKKRDFKGVFIPKEIWISRDLNASQKLIWAEINSLDNEFGCIAENNHFMDMFGMKERTVQNNIKTLKDKGYISVEINKQDDSRTIRIVGKYRHLSEREIAELSFLKDELLRSWVSQPIRRNGGATSRKKLR